jgi:hypothetical protein
MRRKPLKKKCFRVSSHNRIMVASTTPEYVKSLAKAAKKAKTTAEAKKVVSRAKKLAKSPSEAKRMYGMMIIAAMVGTTAAGLAVYKYKGGNFKDLPAATKEAFANFGDNLKTYWSGATWDNLKGFFGKMKNKISGSASSVGSWIKGLFGAKKPKIIGVKRQLTGTNGGFARRTLLHPNKGGKSYMF